MCSYCGIVREELCFSSVTQLFRDTQAVSEVEGFSDWLQEGKLLPNSYQFPTVISEANGLSKNWIAAEEASEELTHWREHPDPEELINIPTEFGSELALGSCS